MDRASQALALGVPPGVSRSIRALADYHNVPRTTVQHRKSGRPPPDEKAQSQQYLYPWEEKALVKFAVHQDALGHPIRIKYLRSIAFGLACRRVPADRPSKPPGKNWPQSFYKRHPDLTASKAGAMDWNRFDIYDKVTHWFEVINIELFLDIFVQSSQVMFTTAWLVFQQL
jgi:hypothetical protein